MYFLQNIEVPTHVLKTPNRFTYLTDPNCVVFLWQIWRAVLVKQGVRGIGNNFSRYFQFCIFQPSISALSLGIAYFTYNCYSTIFFNNANMRWQIAKNVIKLAIRFYCIFCKTVLPIDWKRKYDNTSYWRSKEIALRPFYWHGLIDIRHG